MPEVPIDFDVWKALTALRKHERHSYNDVLRELLDLGPIIEAEPHPKSLPGTLLAMGESIANAVGGHPYGEGLYSRGLFIPNGTQLRATYKGKAYRAVIQDGEWVSEDGSKHTSPSGAASDITKTTVNGWRFWEAKRSDDEEWRRLDMLS